MTHEFKVNSLKELDDKSPIFRYRFVKQNYKDLYKIFAENSNKKEFRQSRNSVFLLIFLPTLVNLYYTFINRNSIFKNSIRIATVCGCFLNFGAQLYTDLMDVGKTDTPAGNKIKKMWQNISYNEATAPDFGEDTLRIARQRKETENINNQK